MIYQKGVINMVYKRQEQIFLNPLKRLKATNLFCCAGINEFYLDDIGVDVVLANEISNTRAQLRNDIYKKKFKNFPDRKSCKTVIGDITNEKTEQKLIELANKERIDILLASPKCQSFCGLNLYKQTDDKERFLFRNVLYHLKCCSHYKYVAIENAAEFKDAELAGCKEKVGQLVTRELQKLGFNDVKIAIQNAADFGTPMNRRRTIIIGSKCGSVDLPKPTIQKHITLKQAIYDLPSIEAGEVSGIKYHNGLYLPKEQAEMFKFVPSGTRVEKPFNQNGQPSKAVFEGAFHRSNWDEPMHSVLTGSSVIGGLFTVHPGRKVLNKSGQEEYTDRRVFSILEILRCFGLPDDMPFPAWAQEREHLLRVVLGEAWAPLHCQAVVAQFVYNEMRK